MNDLILFLAGQAESVARVAEINQVPMTIYIG